MYPTYATLTYSIDTLVLIKDKEKVWECQHSNWQDGNQNLLHN